MNSLWIGFIGIGVVFFAAAQTGDFRTYLQWHSFTIVFGGTLAILFISNPRDSLVELVRNIRLLLKPEENFALYRPELEALMSKKENTRLPFRHPLVAYGAQLWVSGVDAELFIVLLSQHRRELELRGSDTTRLLRNLSKYPPALGMLGTVMGMISLFAAIDANKGSIGYHLSLSMTATFFGLVLANGVLSPLADRLHQRENHRARILDGVYEILLLINRGEASALLKGELDERAA